MKRLFTKLFIFALLFVVIDAAIGKGFSKLIANTRGGKNG